MTTDSPTRHVTLQICTEDRSDYVTHDDRIPADMAGRVLAQFTGYENNWGDGTRVVMLTVARPNALPLKVTRSVPVAAAEELTGLVMRMAASR